MGSRFDSQESRNSIHLHDDFVRGLHCFESKDFAGALMFFRTADGSAELDDVYQNRYTSFHGLSRVFMGDENGVKLCRKAAAGETVDAEVFYNLAMAEQRLGFRESALMALRRGLNIKPDHAGLLRLKQECSRRGARRGMKPDNIVRQLLTRILGHSR
jgi:tetratricopeptide (TPR) repeat protein